MPRQRDDRENPETKRSERDNNILITRRDNCYDDDNDDNSK